jgi:hypothetical protein
LAEARAVDPFRGRLPQIRRATGTIVAAIGSLALVGLWFDLPWLAAGWTRDQPMSGGLAGAMTVLGALMMLARSRPARIASWIFAIAAGAVLMRTWHFLPMPDGEHPGEPALHLGALLLLLTGVRTFFAPQALSITATIDGVLLGVSGAALLGHVLGFTPLYADNPAVSGLPLPAALQFLAIGILFWIADLEYARLDPP